MDPAVWSAMPWLRLLLVVFIAAPSARAQHLVAIGGGPRPPEVVAEVVRLGGGADGRLVVVSAASAEPEDVGTYQAEQFADAGMGRVVVALGHPDADSTVALFTDATAVFFSGGDQNRLVAAWGGTRALDAVRAVYARGGVVAGTSAGAAVLSRVMLTGDERQSDDPFSTVEPDNVATAEGFGFLTAAIVDQHFVTRRRQNRLLSVVLERADLLGLGIDEETAVVVAPDGSMRVVGRRGVQVFDARGATVEPRERGFSATGVRLHLLLDGDVLTPDGDVVPRGR